MRRTEAVAEGAGWGLGGGVYISVADRAVSYL